MDIKKIIQENLNIPVIQLFEPILPPCATFYPINDSTGLAGDGKETETLESFQVDIWDRDRGTLKSRGRKLKAAIMMEENPTTIPEVTYSYDNNGKMWRAMLTFSVLREE